MPAEVHWCQEGFRVSVAEPTAGAPQDETGCARVLYLCTEEPTEPPNDCAPAKDGRAGGDRLDCNLSPLTSKNTVCTLAWFKRKGKCLPEVGVWNRFHVLGIKPVPCILSCSQIRCWGESLFSIFITLQLLSKDHATVKLAGESGCLNQNCQFSDNRYKWESFWHNAFIYTPLERIHCTAHPGFVYKTFLLDKIVVHFPIKILRHFIKSKGNKRSLILFSTKRYQPGASSRNAAWGKAEFQHEAEALPVAPNSLLHKKPACTTHLEQSWVLTPFTRTTEEHWKIRMKWSRTEGSLWSNWACQDSKKKPFTQALFADLSEAQEAAWLPPY